MQRMDNYQLALHYAEVAYADRKDMEISLMCYSFADEEVIERGLQDISDQELDELHVNGLVARSVDGGPSYTEVLVIGDQGQVILLPDVSPTDPVASVDLFMYGIHVFDSAEALREFFR